MSAYRLLWAFISLLGLPRSVHAEEARLFLVAEIADPCDACDSYVLPLRDPSDIAHARELIRLGPGEGLGGIAVARIAPGADGVNRNHRAPGAPALSWHVTEFLGFAEVTIELCDGTPTQVEADVQGWIENTGSTICFWSYTVVEELGPIPRPVLTLRSPGPTLPGEGFGTSVAAVGRNILVGGGHVSDPGGSSVGAVHLFDSADGEVLLSVADPRPELDGPDFDFFGVSVAAAGGNLLVGALNDEVGDDPNGEEAGAAYLFHGADGALLHAIPNPEPSPGDLFGIAVAGVGGNLLVGSSGDIIASDPNGFEAGSAYLFDGGTAELLLKIPNPDPGRFDQFGFAVAAVGGKLLVGAPGDGGGRDPNGPNPGSVYVFDGASGEQLLRIPNPDPGFFDRFGAAVAGVEGNVLVGAPLDDVGSDPNGLGAGSVYLFDGTSGAELLRIPNPSPGIGEGFGFAVAGASGNLLVGSPGDEPTASGSAYLFGGTSGELLLRIPNPDPVFGGFFGFSVASVDEDLLVGAPGNEGGGTVYLFRNDPDSDGRPRYADNCPNVFNPDQADADSSGVGDVCQCGDVDGDGGTGLSDGLRIARGEVLTTDPSFGKCDVDGDGFCNVVDALRIARGEVGELPEQQRCPAYGGAVH